MHEVGLHIIEQPLIMRDQQHRLVGLAHDGVDSVADRLQRIDVEPAVGLVEDRELGPDDPHLHHLVALLLAAREADVDRAFQHLVIEPETGSFRASNFDELGARQRRLAALLALRVERLAQELQIGDAGDLDGILEAQEQAGGGALVRRHVEQVGAVEGGRALGHLIAGPAAERVGERRLARAIGAHDRMDLARIDRERDALEDRLAGGFGVEVLNVQHDAGPESPSPSGEGLGWGARRRGMA